MGSNALILAPFSDEALDALREAMTVKHESWTKTLRLFSPEELVDRINGDHIDVLVIEADFVFGKVFQQAPTLRFLGVCRSSLAHVDLQGATEHGVLVVNTPGRNAQGVAELTIGLMLSMARRIPRLDSYVKSGSWEDPVEPYISMRGEELGGKKLGIIGLGNIGRAVSKLARAFGMEVVAHDPYVDSHSSKVSGAQLGPLDHLLKVSDFVSIHIPANDETNGLLGLSSLMLMKPGSYIINVADHSVIQEDALVQCLTSGHLAGAALDVHPTHPIAPSSPLLNMENVILTPHVGGATDGTVRRQSCMMADDIGRYLRYERPKYLVNGAAWRDRG